MDFLNKYIGALLYGLLKLTAYLPLKLLYLKADAISYIAEKVIRYRYPVIIQNLSRAFPEKNYHEIKEVAHQFYRHFFRVFAEVIRSQAMKPEEVRKRYNLTNPELIRDLHRKELNILVLGGHWGNWEWGIMTPLFFSFSAYTLYKPLSSKTTEYLMARIRRHFGLKLLPMQQAGRFILSKKDFPALYFFIGDQSPSHKNPEYRFNFLNQPSFFFNGGARLALATKSAVIYQSISRIKPGYYDVTFRLVSLPGDDQNEQDILRKYATLLEADIRSKPSYWLWSHKRWKHRAE
ncbi:lysophospholipid acyltransferase family protein [Lentimicrobium sp.]|uniref:lysophospholipid acyltransferase family protein n=1 Tax=Lentimicrobium sp. TaxID=2034841 RepID=UPI0025F10713|nr:lysophospholipid acyltransferase family protein [Lentimicrobium sp.]MCO5256049.1 lysophospholipid acyltransferase family protein [Lentimicrobium sp.]MCO5262244.1 lysophospholipid acyltransferase family protein [Lentimicrobium sp.]HPF63796.1 lysophospholipid acyltransferase family protein [Lentimicrobium sp.]HPR25348.1 lysophospholipid acyltransferase family protein [Lentimicrobium sp.]HRW68621.1 lysophospholipid acyltransferase family protein [Lentimicrobium sp.]